MEAEYVIINTNNKRTLRCSHPCLGLAWKGITKDRIGMLPLGCQCKVRGGI